MSHSKRATEQPASNNVSSEEQMKKAEATTLEKRSIYRSRVSQTIKQTSRSIPRSLGTLKRNKLLRRNLRLSNINTKRVKNTLQIGMLLQRTTNIHKQNLMLPHLNLSLIPLHQPAQINRIHKIRPRPSARKAALEQIKRLMKVLTIPLLKVPPLTS